jgi:serine/threonine protein kinase/class 3 adenylate cyclase
LRHVTIFFSDIAGFSELNRSLGDRQAAQIANRFLALQEIIITRDGAGTVLHFGGDSVFAVFDHASVALNRALEIQRVLDPCAQNGKSPRRPRLRIGLHTGEVLVQEGERIELVSRHINRAHRVMEAAAPGQILASDFVVDAARDFIDLPRERLAIQSFGEFYLKDVGATCLCEVADLAFRQPEPPALPASGGVQSGVLSRLELAGYRSVSRLGEGSFGVVYRAEQEGNGKPVAVKVLNRALSDEPAARASLARELEKVQKLGLPGVVRIIEERLDHRPPFFVMDLVEGHPADEALAGAKPERIAEVFRDLCKILAAVHTAGVVHRDLKPNNILVSKDDSVVVMDIGLAILASSTDNSKSSSTNLLGTPAFLAPEIIQGRLPSPQADVYALGVMLFIALTGRHPFAGSTVHDIVQAHLHEDPPPPSAIQPDVADGLQRICLKALEKKPADRYEHAGKMGEDLSRFLRGEVVRTRPTTYDNLLFHRVQEHLNQIRDWGSRGLLSAEESHRLLSSYEGLQRRGLPAVMEGRSFRLWQTLVYVGGWAVINGALLWLIQHWNELSRLGKLTLGSLPALTTFILAASMWRLERFRLTFIALIVAVLSVPLVTGVWLHEFNIVGAVPTGALSLQLFHDHAESSALTNQQMLLTAFATLIVACSVMCFTRTATHSAQTLVAFAAAYASVLLLYGLRTMVEADQWAAIAMRMLPLFATVAGIATALLRSASHYHQAPPWVYLGAALFLVIGYAISLHGLNEWTSLSAEIRRPLSFVLLSLTGAVQATVGVWSRTQLKHHCRLATLIVLLAGLVCLLAGLGLAGWAGTWPPTWPTVPVFGQAVALPHVVLPIAALGVTLLACRYQILAFLIVGLAGVAFSVHVLGHLYFQTVSAWPKGMMILGAICFFTALYHELRRTRGNTIDDVVNQARL